MVDDAQNKAARGSVQQRAATISEDSAALCQQCQKTVRHDARDAAQSYDIVAACCRPRVSLCSVHPLLLLLFITNAFLMPTKFSSHCADVISFQFQISGLGFDWG
jgi:hypothetical protein